MFVGPASSRKPVDPCQWVVWPQRKQEQGSRRENRDSRKSKYIINRNCIRGFRANQHCQGDWLVYSLWAAEPRAARWGRHEPEPTERRITCLLGTVLASFLTSRRPEESWMFLLIRLIVGHLKTTVPLSRRLVLVSRLNFMNYLCDMYTQVPRKRQIRRNGMEPLLDTFESKRRSQYSQPPGIDETCN